MCGTRARERELLNGRGHDVSDPELTTDQRQFRAGDPTIDQRVARAASGRLRTILPDELLARFEALQNLNVAAGQADLVLARDRSTGEDVVVKLYRNSAQLDREVMARLYEADPAHVVRLIDHGESDGEPWEVQEYCELGTLTDFRLDRGGALAEDVARQAVRELADAIEHIHSLGITHRDLKPENVLVRTLDPLDLVLTDFGVAAEQIVTVQLQTIAASWAWAAPEVHTKGTVARSIDWWAMGAMVHQMLTGNHPLAGPDGRLPSDGKLIRAGVVDGIYSAEAISSPRWRNLVDGLLSYDPAERWGYSEVNAWLAGTDPDTPRPRRSHGSAVPEPATPQRTTMRPDPPAESRKLMYVFNGHPVRTGFELVAAMRQDWKAANKLLKNWPDRDLKGWLQTRPDGELLVRAIGMEQTGAARFIRLQAEFDPDSPLEFQGRPVSDESLSRAIESVAGATPGPGLRVADSDAQSWLEAIRDQRILAAVAATIDGPASAVLLRADQRLQSWTEQARAFLDQTVSDWAWVSTGTRLDQAALTVDDLEEQNAAPSLQELAAGGRWGQAPAQQQARALALLKIGTWRKARGLPQSYLDRGDWAKAVELEKKYLSGDAYEILSAVESASRDEAPRLARFFSVALGNGVVSDDQARATQAADLLRSIIAASEEGPGPTKPRGSSPSRTEDSAAAVEKRFGQWVQELRQRLERTDPADAGTLVAAHAVVAALAADRKAKLERELAALEAQRKREKEAADQRRREEEKRKRREEAERERREAAERRRQQELEEAEKRRWVPEAQRRWGPDAGDRWQQARHLAQAEERGRQERERQRQEEERKRQQEEYRRQQAERHEREAQKARDYAQRREAARGQQGPIRRDLADLARLDHELSPYLSSFGEGSWLGWGFVGSMFGVLPGLLLGLVLPSSATMSVAVPMSVVGWFVGALVLPLVVICLRRRKRRALTGRRAEIVAAINSRQDAVADPKWIERGDHFLARVVSAGDRGRGATVALPGGVDAKIKGPWISGQQVHVKIPDGWTVGGYGARGEVQLESARAEDSGSIRLRPGLVTGAIATLAVIFVLVGQNVVSSRGDAVPATGDIPIVAWGPMRQAGWQESGSAQTEVPDGLSDAVQLAAGSDHFLALRADGTVVGWGDDSEGQADVPDGLSDVAGVAAWGSTSVAVKADGTIVAWGSADNIPTDLTRVVQVAEGIALLANGSVSLWGWSPCNDESALPVPELATNVVQVDGNGRTRFALRADGLIVAWEYYCPDGSVHASVDDPATLPTGAIQIAANGEVALALLSDGNVEAWGLDPIEQNERLSLPSDFRDLRELAVGGGDAVDEGYAVGVLSDGTVKTVRLSNGGYLQVPRELDDVSQVVAGDEIAAALRGTPAPGT